MEKIRLFITSVVSFVVAGITYLITQGTPLVKGGLMAAALGAVDLVTGLVWLLLLYIAIEENHYLDEKVRYGLNVFNLASDMAIFLVAVVGVMIGFDFMTLFKWSAAVIIVKTVVTMLIKCRLHGHNFNQRMRELNEPSSED
jgi:hypothetical protein